MATGSTRSPKAGTDATCMKGNGSGTRRTGKALIPTAMAARIRANGSVTRNTGKGKRSTLMGNGILVLTLRGRSKAMGGMSLQMGPRMRVGGL